MAFDILRTAGTVVGCSAVISCIVPVLRQRRLAKLSASPPGLDTMLQPTAVPIIFYLGHAGYLLRYKQMLLLIDPWFSGAFSQSWFPNPDNYWLRDVLLALADKVSHVFISHMHEDHLDIDFLTEFTRRSNPTAICAAFRSGELAATLRSAGFQAVVEVQHCEAVKLNDSTFTIYMDTSSSEDSGILVDMGGIRFLHLNDNNCRLDQLPKDVHVVSAQFSGAMYYPQCYDYPIAALRSKSAAVNQNLLRSLQKKLSATEAKVYLPSAGPPVFLDPELQHFNPPAHRKAEADETIFLRWPEVSESFSDLCPETTAVPLQPGAALQLSASPDSSCAQLLFQLEPPAGAVATSVFEYACKRSDEWGRFHTQPFDRVTTSDLKAYFEELRKKNMKYLNVGSFSRVFVLHSDGETWTVYLDRTRVDVSEGKCIPTTVSSQATVYEMTVPGKILRDIVSGVQNWEHALLSMRITLHRDPDVYDSDFLLLLRHGHAPPKTKEIVQTRVASELVEVDSLPGVRFQRFCPHAGEDLRNAIVCNGVIECPRHHWKWDAATGKCLSGGMLDLRIEKLDW